jgi:hypothetical protein
MVHKVSVSVDLNSAFTTGIRFRFYYSTGANSLQYFVLYGEALAKAGVANTDGGFKKRMKHRSSAEWSTMPLQFRNPTSSVFTLCSYLQ